MALTPVHSEARPPSGIKEFYTTSLLVIILSNLAAVINFGFQGLLRPHLEGEQFALLNALFQLGNFLLLPALIYAAILQRHSAELIHEGKQAQAAALFHSSILFATAFALLSAPLGWFLTPLMTWWLNTDQTSLVQLQILGASVSIVLTLASPLANAQQWFLTLAFGSILGALLRIGFGWTGILTHHPMEWAIVGSFLAGSILFFITWARTPWPGWSRLSLKQLHFPAQEWISSLLMALGTFFILGSDLLMVQRFFPLQESSIYAQVAILARIIFFLIGPLAFIVFPKSATSKLPESMQLETKVLKRALIFGTFLLILAATVLSRFSEQAFGLLRIKPDPDSVHFLALSVWSVIPLSLCQLVLPMLFASRRESLLWQFTFIASLHPLGIALWHQNLYQIFILQAGVGTLLLLFILLRLKRSSGGIRAQE